jgi:hypothetical protein
MSTLQTPFANYAKSFLLCSLAVLTTLLFQSLTARSQTYDVKILSSTPRLISYQGILSQNGKPAADGNYSIRVVLYADANGAESIWSDKFNSTLSNGVFNIMLGSGATSLPSSTTLDRPLWIGIQVEGQPEMRPLAQLSAAPYALNVADSSISSSKLQAGSVTWDKIAAEYVPYLRVNGAKISTNQSSINFTGGVGVKLDYDSSSMSVIIRSETPTGKGSQNGKDPQLQFHNGTSDYWGETGNNSTTAGTNYIGTSDNNPLMMKVNGSQVMMYLPNTTSNNIQGGYSGNTIGTVAGCVIAGGGKLGAINSIGADFSAISGGTNNVITSQSDHSVLVGGEDNTIDTADHAFLGGGRSNSITSNLLGEVVSGGVLVGGQYNTCEDEDAFLGGGIYNHATAELSIVVAGEHNSANGDISTIVGGAYNTIVDASHSPEDDGKQSFIGGGSYNTINALSSSITGGDVNYIERNANESYIGGGDSNYISTFAGAIAGGQQNRILFGGYQTYYHSFIGGGASNTIVTSLASITGGYLNYIDSNAIYSHIGGGKINYIVSPYSAIGGGELNYIDGTANHSFVGGGWRNYIQGPYSAIAGGDSNYITNAAADHNFIGGGFRNVEANPSYGVIGGGLTNLLDVYSWASTIGGGDSNIIRSHHSFVGGGRLNTIEVYDDYSALGGGAQNRVWSNYTFLGGGYENFAHGLYSTLGGGDSNTLQAYYGFLGGGAHNEIDYNSDTSVVGGGAFNYIHFGRLSVLGGGLLNKIISSYVFLGGGVTNRVDSNSDYSALVGGQTNNIYKSKWSLLGGGTQNWIKYSNYSTLGGGITNVIDSSSPYSVLGGGSINYIFRNPGAMLGGGEKNVIAAYPCENPRGGCLPSVDNFLGGGDSNYILSTSGGWNALGGGWHNLISGPSFNFIGGGSGNFMNHLYGVIGGGLGNTVSAYIGTIAGGDTNLVSGDYGAIPGGRGLVSQSYAQFVAGRYNTLQGTSSPYTIVPDDNLVIIGNGTSNAARSDAATISNKGYISVFGQATSGGATGPAVSLRIGTTYADNTIEAWGNVVGGGNAVTDDAGVTSVVWGGVGTGLYTITLNNVKQDGTAYTYVPNTGSIVATLVTQPIAPVAGMISVSQLLLGGIFKVTTYDKLGVPNDHFPFMFHVVLR